MNSFKKLTRTSLKMNKKRTIVTIIGIMLATALICAVATMAMSFKSSLVEYERAKNGNYHYCFYNVPANELDTIENNRNVSSYYLVSNLGFSVLDGSQNSDKPYLLVQGMDSLAIKNARLNLLDGRMPETAGEVVISNHIKTNGGVKYNIGDTLTLNVGQREDTDGYVLDKDYPFMQKNEKLVNETPMTFKIVGIVDRPSYYMEERECPGYSIFTYMDDSVISGNTDIYVELSKTGLKNQYEFLEGIIGVNASILEKADNGMLTEDEIDLLDTAKYTYGSNYYLIKYLTMSFSDSMMKVLFNLAAIIIVIIVITSAFCIRNSFAISITEKMKQYGMLSSIGATSKQIKKNVYYEAFVLSTIGIPLGIALGELASFVVIKIVSGLLEDILFPLQYSISVLAIVFAVLLSIVMIFISARKPAKKASRISPIDAIRETTDIKISSKSVKCPRYVKKMFGTGGVIAYKNMKRNRKKYRTVVISITLSVAIFLGLFSFMNLAFRSVKYYAGEQNYNLSLFLYDMNRQYDAVKEYTNDDSVNRISITRHSYFDAPADSLKYINYNQEEENVIISIYGLGETEYNRYINELGLKYEDVKDKAIIINDHYVYDDSLEKYVVTDLFDYKAGDTIGGTCSAVYDEEEKIIPIEFTIAAVTDKHPLGLEGNYSDTGILIVSDEWLNSHPDVVSEYGDVYIQTDKADALQESIEADEALSDINIYNKDKEYREQHSLFLVISIFVYGFITVISLIGITNILNTVTTSMEVRSKEFAMLRSVGMSHREFNRMIRLENIFYGGKALVLGLILGNIIAVLFQKAIGYQIEMSFQIPWVGMIISIAAVVILLSCIMRFSLNKIYRQNIIETIRQDNL